MVAGNRSALSIAGVDDAVPVPSHAGFAIEVVDNEAGMLALGTEWNRLISRLAVPNIFSTFEWCWGWWTLIAPRLPGRKHRLRVLVIRQGNEITGIVPLALRVAVRNGLSIRKLEFIGGDDLPDYQGPLFVGAPEAQARAVAEYLARDCAQWDILELHNLPPDSARIWRRAMEKALAVRIVEGENCPFFAIEGPWQTAAHRVSKATRQTLRYQENRLQREGVRIRVLERPDAEPGLLDRMAELESRKLVRGAAGDRLLSRWPQFFGWVFQQLGAKGWVAAAVMEKQDRLIAYNLLFCCGQSIWDYAKAYDPAYAKLSPGTMLLPAIVEYAHARGYTEYDFLRGAEPYKLKWATGVRSTQHLHAWHGDWRSRASALLYFRLHRPVCQMLARLGARA